MHRIPLWLLAALLPLVFDSALKGAVLLAVAALVALVLWRASAAARHLVWLVAIVALLIVPVLSVALPQWRVLPQWAGGAVAVRTENRPYTPYKPHRAYEEPLAIAGDPALEEDLSPAPAPVAPLAAAPAAPIPHPVSRIPHLRWRDWLPLAWCLGFALLAIRLLAAHLLLRRATRGCTIPADPTIHAAFAQATQQLRIRQRITLLLDKKRTIPVVWGVFRPRLMLPLEAREWSEEQLRSVLLHELAHIKRRDTLVQWLTQIACALHWWNPLVWLAAWRLHTERERACDDLVLASGVRPSAYAEHLLNVATRLAPVRWTSACGLAMARKSSLEGRLLAVLSDKLNRKGVTRALTAAALILGAIVAIPLAMLRAADDKWSPPQAAHIGTQDFTTYCVHDGETAAYIIAYHGDFGSSSTHDSNPKTRTWSDAVTLTLKTPVGKKDIALSRDHTAPEKLALGEKDYDLKNGRLFLLNANAEVRQFPIALPVVQDRAAAEQLKKKIDDIPQQVEESLIQQELIALTFTNSLGMEFVFIGKTDFARNLVRVKDYEQFTTATGRAVVSTNGASWKSPGFPQTPEHPMVNVSWNDAVSFCEWLTKVERDKGQLKANEAYRLPTDLEWSAAVGMPQEQGATPGARDLAEATLFPWGTAWPPPNGAGNYAGEETDSNVKLHGYLDGFKWTSPVGSFAPNALGLFDMGGNVWQWTMDDIDAKKERKALRGASWYNGGVKPSLLLSARISAKPTDINDTYGFRIVKKPDARAKPPTQARQWNDHFAAVAYQTERDVNFVLIHEGFISTGLSESSADNGKWRIEGNIHLVDAEKTKAAGHNVDKRKVALQYTSDAPGTLMLDGKQYDLGKGGRVFILRDQDEPEQLEKTLPLRDKADLEKLGEHVRWQSSAGERRVVFGAEFAKERIELVQLNAKREAALVRYQPDHRVVKALDEEIAASNSKLTALRIAVGGETAETQQLIRKRGDAVISNLGIQLATLNEEQTRLLKVFQPGHRQVLSVGDEISELEVLRKGVRKFLDDRDGKKEGEAGAKSPAPPGPANPEPKFQLNPQAMLDVSRAVKKKDAPPFVELLGEGGGQLDFNLRKPFRPRIISSEDLAAINAAKERYSEVVKRYNELQPLYAQNLIPRQMFEEAAQALRDAQLDYPIIIDAKWRSKPVVVAKLPDSEYVKTGVPLSEVKGMISQWGDDHDELRMGMRIVGGGWRIGGEVKVELWVCNPSQKDVRFQTTTRADVGLRLTMTGSGGKYFDSGVVPDFAPLATTHHLLPAGYIFKVKEFSVQLLSMESDAALAAGPYLKATPGEYKFRCAVDMPGFTANGAEGKRVTPAEDEWAGTLKSPEVPVKVLAAEGEHTRKAVP